MTYKHLHILSQREVSSLCILPKTHAPPTLPDWHIHIVLALIQHWLSQCQKLQWQSNCREVDALRWETAWLRRVVWLFLPFRLEPDLIT